MEHPQVTLTQRQGYQFEHHYGAGLPVLLADEWAMVARFHGDLEIRDRLNDLYAGRRELGGDAGLDDDIA